MTSSAPGDPSSTTLGFGGHQLLGLVVLLAAIWLSSGTMAPYAATLDTPLVLKPCNYLANVDHEQFRKTFLMLDGALRDKWEDSIVLRRILFPVLSYPLMTWTSFEVGGFITSLLLHAMTFIWFTAFLRRKIGDTGATAALWLLATYPGIPYWAGLPYSYASIVPISLVAFVLLWQVSDSEQTGVVLWCCGGLGILFLGYDILPFVLPAVAGVLVIRRRWMFLPAALMLLIAPTFLWNYGVLHLVFGISPLNSNSDMYVTVFRSYVTRPNLFAWARLLLRFPLDTIRIYLFSNFLFLPLFFTLFWRYSSRIGIRLSLAERSFLLTIIAIYLFNNLAPPYRGVQIRGSYIARLYQPAFVALLVFAARCIGRLDDVGGAMRRWGRRALVITVLMNASVGFGHLVHNPLTPLTYLQFYGHGNRDANNLWNNLAKYGRRPLGVCRRD